MRNVMLLLLPALLFSSPLFGQTPAGAEALEARLMTRVGPQTRNWIRREAAREHAAGSVSVAAARRAVAANSTLLGVSSPSDIEALTFFVLMEASKSEQQELKEIMDLVKRVNDAKAALRRMSVQRAKPAMAKNCKSCPSRAATTPQGKAVPPRLGTRPARVAVRAGALSRLEFDRQLQAARNDPDRLAEMGEMESVRLQMAMDRTSRLMSALSNVMKKISDTDASITRNLK